MYLVKYDIYFHIKNIMEEKNRLKCWKEDEETEYNVLEKVVIH